MPLPLAPSPSSPTLRDLTRIFARIGCLSFGGPVGQIALMHRELVDDRQWIDDAHFLRALNFCHLLPGPEAQQLATYIGWRLHGTIGALIAGLLFVIPGAIVMLLLSLLYVTATGSDWFTGLFLGIKAAVLAIVAQALIRIGKRALDTPLKRGIAAAAFLALALFNLPFPLVIVAAGVIGIVHSLRTSSPLPATDMRAPVSSWPLIRASVRTALLWLLIWAAPIAGIFLALGPDHILFDIATFFSRLAVVTFGGAYAVLAYMAQAAVQTQGWLSAGEMADGLGLAETTPGPLIMVTQFVGFIAAFRVPEPFTPITAGILGAAITTWVTFAPCFLFILTLAPWIERLNRAHRLQAGLAAITAAVVGVIANLALWFALHLLFSAVTREAWGPLTVAVPDPRTLDLPALALSTLALWLAFGRKMGPIPILTITAMAGLGLSWVS